MSSAAVRQTERKAGRGQAKGGVMTLDPLHEHTLVMAGVNRGAEDDCVIVRRRGLLLIRLKLVRVDGRAVGLEHEVIRAAILACVRGLPDVQDVDVWHGDRRPGAGCVHGREIRQQIAVFYGPLGGVLADDPAAFPA